jgi:hypothetical protein
MLYQSHKRMLKHSISVLLCMCLSVLTLNSGWAQEEEFETGGMTTIDDSRCENPDVLLLLDRSGSMLNDMKWEQATSAVNEVFVSYFDTLRFGMLMFPTEGACGVIENPLAISVGEASNADLSSIFDDSLPVDIALTPLTESINAGKRALDMVKEPNRRGFLILLTDGIETCVPEDLSDSAPINAVRAATDAGYTTYVVGFGSLVRRNTLREMARAGGSERERLVSDQESLVATFNEIIMSATTEQCDLLDNDCDGRIDEGIECETPCYPELQDCPCTGSFECNQGEICVEGNCAPEPCQIRCDQNYICRNEECIPLEGLPSDEDDSSPAGAQTGGSNMPNFGGTTPSFGENGDNAGVNTPTSGEMPQVAQEASMGCQAYSLRVHPLLPMTWLLCMSLLMSRRPQYGVKSI